MPTYNTGGKPLLFTKRNPYEECQRKCRDLLCLVLFVLFWIGMIVIGACARKSGNPEKLIYPHDYNGTLCSPPNDHLFYPHPEADYDAAILTNPSKYAPGIGDPYSIPFYGICARNCPSAGDVVGGFTSTMNTTSAFFRCIPTNATEAYNNKFDFVEGRFLSSIAYIGRFASDIKTAAKPIMIIGAVGALLAALVWIIFLTLMPSCIVWISILSALVSMVLATFLCAYEGELLTFSQGEIITQKLNIGKTVDNVKYFKAATIVLAILDVLFVCVLLTLCSRINLSIGIIKEAGKAITNIPFLFFFPVIPAGLLASLFIYWAVIATYIASSNSINFNDIKNATGTMVSSKIAFESEGNIMWYLLWYHLFGLLWTEQLIEAIMICTIAGAVCRYYWTDEKKNLGWPVVASFYRSFRYHLGSLAFGALIIGIVQFLRIILEYIDNKTKGTQNRAVKVLVCCCRVCLWCMEKCIKFLNKNGYIIIAMKGTNFCVSITDAFNLLFANALRIATVSVISTYVLFLGKIAISTVCMIGAYYWIQTHYTVTNIVVPVIVTGILSLCMSYFYLAVFDIATDTILLSVCEDEKVNGGTGSYYASPAIRSYLDNSSDHAFTHHKKRQQEASPSPTGTYQDV